MFQDLRRNSITSVHLIFSCILSLASGWTSFLYSKCINFTSDPINPTDAILKALKGSVTIGGEAIPVFNTAVLSSDATQTGVSLSGVEETELVLVLLPFNGYPTQIHADKDNY